MEIPDEKPRKPAPPKKKAEASAPQPELDPLLSQAARIVASSAAGIVHSRSKLNMLSFLLHECNVGELQRSPEEGIPQAVERNRVEKFLLDRSESPLQESSDAKRYFEMLDRPIQAIDESDPSPKTLRDILEEKQPERLQEMRQAMDELLKEDTIQERIQDILIQSSPELLQDYQEYQDVVGEMAKEQNINLILGNDAKEESKEDFRSILKEEEKECKAWSMLEAEKARILCNALTLPKDSDRREQLLKEARDLLGEDTVRLVEEQVHHTNQTILRLHATDTPPSGTPEEVICPAILERMGEGGPNKQQVQALAEVQDFYLFRRGETQPSNEELSHQTARTVLASLYVVEHGRWIENANVLKEYHEVLNSKRKDIGKFVENNKEKEPEETPKEEPKDSKGEVPKAKKAEKDKKGYPEYIAGITQIIETYNEGVTDDTYRVDTQKLLSAIRHASGDNISGLMQLDENDFKKAGCPKALAVQITKFLHKDKEKQAARQKPINSVRRMLENQTSKMSKTMFAKVYKSLKEEVLHEEGKDFAENEGIHRSMQSLRVTTMDQS